MHTYMHTRAWSECTLGLYQPQAQQVQKETHPELLLGKVLLGHSKQKGFA